jgi:hypothetical protein
MFNTQVQDIKKDNIFNTQLQDIKKDSMFNTQILKNNIKDNTPDFPDLYLFQFSKVQICLHSTPPHTYFI